MRTLFRETEELALALGDIRYLPHLAYGLGMSALELGLYAEAKVLCQKGLEQGSRRQPQMQHNSFVQFAHEVIGYASNALG